MTDYYIVSAMVTEYRNDGTISRQVPTFSLSTHALGIVDENHAEVIAEGIINPCKTPHVVVNAKAVRIKLD